MNDTSRSTTNLHLGKGSGAEVHDYQSFAAFAVGDDHAEVTLFVKSPDTPRLIAEQAATWAELVEAKDRGEDVAVWGSWVVPSDTFGGDR